MNNRKAKYIWVLLFLVLLVYFLRQVFAGIIILPQSLNIGPLIIRYYGIIMAIAVAAAFYLAMRRTSAYGFDPKQAEDILFWLIIGGFIGARLYHVASSFPYYLANPLDSLKVWNGGLSIYGAVIGGFLTALILQRIFHFKFFILHFLDWLAPSLVLGQIIGRFGNMFNYEAFGYPTNLPWKMFVPLQFRPAGFEQFSFFHPFFLYEALGNAVILYLLLKVFEPKLKIKPQPGSLFFLYLLLYNILRFGLEFLRTDSTFINGFRLNAVASLLLAIFAGIMLVFVANKARPKNLANDQF